MAIRLSKDGKQFYINFRGADVTSNITIRAKKNTNSTTKFKGGILQYRRKVA